MKYEPMLALPIKGDPDPMWAMEPKLDGTRIILSKTGDTVSIETRRDINHAGKAPHIEPSLKAVGYDYVLDGEFIVVQNVVELSGQQIPIADFEAAQSIMLSSKGVAIEKQKDTKVTFVVFDCLVYQGQDIRNVPDALRRQQALKVVADIDNQYVQIIPRFSGWDEAFFDALVEMGGEGVMLKNPLARYQSGRRPTQTWGKVKARDTADVVIMGYKPGDGGFKSLVGAVEFGQYKNGVLTARSRCSGMDMKMRRELTENGDSYIGRVMEIKYFGRVGPEQSFRHPNFLRIRDDKQPKECVWE